MNDATRSVKMLRTLYRFPSMNERYEISVIEWIDGVGHGGALAVSLLRGKEPRRATVAVFTNAAKYRALARALMRVADAKTPKRKRPKRAVGGRRP